MRKAYQHSAYWYAYHYGWTFSEKRSYSGQYLDIHSYRPRINSRSFIPARPHISAKSDITKKSYKSRQSNFCDAFQTKSPSQIAAKLKASISNTEQVLSCNSILAKTYADPRDNYTEINHKTYYKDWKAWHESPKLLDSTFNPFVFGVYIAMDIGIAMREQVKTLKDPVERDRIKRELMRDLRIIRRPFYYEREKTRRRELAAERRKIHRRSTTAPMPTPADIVKAWENRKNSQEAMILLGGMLHDLECYVDNCLKFDDTGAVVGRNGGIRGWLKENLPELAPKYKTLMRYKALAVRLRQVTETKDPTPTSSLLDEPRKEKVTALLTETKPFFTHVFEYLEHELSAKTVFLDKPRKVTLPRPKKRRSFRS